jgi:hypothetical protein
VESIFVKISLHTVGDRQEDAILSAFLPAKYVFDFFTPSKAAAFLFEPTSYLIVSKLS